MRIKVVGNSDAAIELRGLLRAEDFLIADQQAHYTLVLEEDPALEKRDYFVIDGIRCRLENRTSEHIHRLGGKNIHLARAGGIQTDRALRLVYAPSDAHIVATGAFRGLLDTCRPNWQKSKLPWWKRAMSGRFIQ